VTSPSQQERRQLADLLERIGPDAPTLCAGWTTADLAAHLVLRERRPDAAVGIAVPVLAGYTERVQQAIRDAHPWPVLVDQVRSGPPTPLRPLDRLVNVVEYFVHHEDVRRAVPDWEPRSPDATRDATLWRRLSTLAPVLFRRFAGGLVLQAPGYGTIRRHPARTAVTVSGSPGELVLVGFGRLGHARVELDGPAGTIEALRGTRLGI
jgi:uncharacterized protein (TIGR03085 family)